MAEKKSKPKLSRYAKQLATRMDIIVYAKAVTGNDRWMTEEKLKELFKESGSSGNNLNKSDKTTKIPKLEEDNKALDSLFKIYDILKTGHDEKLKLFEKQNQFEVEKRVEKKKQHEDFLKSLNKIGVGTTVVNNTVTKVEKESNIFDDVLGPLADLKSLASTLFKVGTFFTGPIGLALLAGTLTMAMLFRDEHPEQTNKGIQAAGDIAEANKQMMDVVENTTGAERRKQNILANRPSSKKSFNIFNPAKDVELQQQYLAEIGFDEKTGLTEAEKKSGYVGVDDNGTPYKKKETSTPQSTPTTPAPVAQPSTQSSLSPGESVVTASEPAAITTPNVSQKFDVVNNENLEMKLPQAPSDKGMMITNNEKTQSKKGSTKVALPSVRNAEETFQRMILNSTRVV